VVNEPPVAVAGEDQLVTTSEVAFDGSASSDADGAIARYEWDFGDGSTGTGATPTHTYDKSGVYRVTLTVTDDSGTIRSSDSDGLRVVVNEAPIADAGPDMIGAPGQALTFAGAGSIDPDGDVIEWLWDFKDGASAAGGQVSHSFERPGTYYVRLQVRDDTEHSAGANDGIADRRRRVGVGDDDVVGAMAGHRRRPSVGAIGGRVGERETGHAETIRDATGSTALAFVKCRSSSTSAN
jgi:chitodextrinase